MKKFACSLLVVLMFFVFQSCSNEDEPMTMTVDPEMLSGEWYLTHINGWMYDSHKHKSEFIKSFHYDRKGSIFDTMNPPIGDNADDALRVCIGYIPFPFSSEPGVFSVGYCNWRSDGQYWTIVFMEDIKLRGNQLIHEDSSKTSIIVLNDSTLITYQKNKTGETWMEYKNRKAL